MEPGDSSHSNGSSAGAEQRSGRARDAPNPAPRPRARFWDAASPGSSETRERRAASTLLAGSTRISAGCWMLDVGAGEARQQRWNSSKAEGVMGMAP